MMANNTQQKVTDSDLLALRQQGLWNREAAQRLGISRRTVHKRLARLARRGIAVPPPVGPRPNPWRKVTDEQVLTLARQGHSARAMAAQLGITGTHVHRRLRLLRQRGLLPPMSPREARRDAIDRQILALRETGLWSRQIAARVGLTMGTVNERLQRLRERGVPVPLARGPRPHALRKVTDDQLIALTQAGRRPAEIAAEVGLARNSVYRRLQSLRRGGWLPPAPRRRRRRAIASRSATENPRSTLAS